jgi:hypothetical protein
MSMPPAIVIVFLLQRLSAKTSDYTAAQYVA